MNRRAALRKIILTPVLVEDRGDGHSVVMSMSHSQRMGELTRSVRSLIANEPV